MTTWGVSYNITNLCLAPGTIVTKSSRGSDATKSGRSKSSRSKEDKGRDGSGRESTDKDREKGRKEDRRKRRRRRHSSSSSSSEEEAVVDDQQIHEQRERRREELRQKRSKKDKRGHNDDNSDGEGSRKGRSRDLSKLTPEERAEVERERDIRERDEFAKRLTQKDKRKQKSNVDRRSHSDGDENNSDSSHSDDSDKKESDAQKRMERLRKREERDRRLARGEEVVLDDSDDDNGDSTNKKKKAISIQDMREQSKRSYLEKRTKRELELLERELADEEELIAKVGGSHSLTAEETRELQLKRDILRMAREHGHVGGDEAEAARKPDGFYRLPDEFDGDQEEHRGKSRAQRGEELLTSRYVEPKQEKSEQQLWEEGQTQMAAGLSRHKKRHKEGGDEDDDEDKYDFVFEEQQIDFVCMDTKKGYDHRNKNKKRHPSKQYEEEEDEASVKEEEKVLEAQPATKHEKILEVRKQLPIYSYREDFLSALQDHQVLVLVG